ncbi:zinc-ribbon and DUF3426 domain-containing protein [Rubrivivax sp. RP6-9]|uniref:zinc-ribbon and DUF3426 domain-containing protein n=1 Tax=Rubrivivax sp. RP6-9 TaxID=3415750 RepID=UPI003CC6A895
MSLAARCPACGTVFRVVQDQLRVSEGWVRCGRCAEVFNAIESLVDLDADPARTAVRSRGTERVVEDMERMARQDELDDLSPLSTFGTPAAPPQAQRRSAPPPPAPASPAPPASAATRRAADAAPDQARQRRDHQDGDDENSAATDRGPTGTPAFVRRAERAARWRRPGVRAALAAVGGVAALCLLAQAALEYRDTTAARWPATLPLLTAACAALDCSIEAPRAIEALTVESSGLLRIDGTPLYRLSVVLRSRAAVALAVPSLDLTLTDSQGAVMARRVIQPQELGVQRANLPPSAEFALQATLSAADRPISGYTIEIFYP